MLPPIVRRTFTVDNAVSNGVWGLVYVGVYAGVSSVVPVILHGVTRLSWPWLAVMGFGMFCLLSAVTLAWWAHQSIPAPPDPVSASAPTIADPTSIRVSAAESAQIAEHCKKTAKAIYAFLAKQANRREEEEDEVVIEYRQKFDSKVINLWYDLFKGGLTAPNDLMAPPTSRETISSTARALAILGEGYSAERVGKHEEEQSKESFRATGLTRALASGEDLVQVASHGLPTQVDLINETIDKWIDATQWIFLQLDDPALAQEFANDVQPVGETSGLGQVDLARLERHVARLRQIVERVVDKKIT